jgi:hypothetical protein
LAGREFSGTPKSPAAISFMILLSASSLPNPGSVGIGFLVLRASKRVSHVCNPVLSAVASHYALREALELVLLRQRLRRTVDQFKEEGLEVALRGAALDHHGRAVDRPLGAGQAAQVTPMMSLPSTCFWFFTNPIGSPPGFAGDLSDTVMKRRRSEVRIAGKQFLAVFQLECRVVVVRNDSVSPATSTRSDRTCHVPFLIETYGGVRRWVGAFSDSGYNLPQQGRRRSAARSHVSGDVSWVAQLSLAWKACQGRTGPIVSC